MMQFSLQEVFDKTVTFLANQGQRAVNRDGGNCAYRANGLKCAYGAWIPDAAYTPDIEGCGLPVVKDAGWSPEKDRALFKVTGLVRDSKHHALLKALQSAHDGSAGAIEFRRKLTKVASDFDLDGYVIGLVSKWVA